MDTLFLMESTSLCPVCTPFTRNGEPYFPLDEPPGDGDFLTSQLLYDLPLADRLSCGHELIVSRRSRDLLKSVVMSTADRFIEVQLLTQAGAELPDEYFVLHPEMQYDILDYGHSEFKFFGDKKTIREVAKWAIQRELIPPLDLFYGFVRVWVASYALVRAVSEAGLTGFKFTELK